MQCTCSGVALSGDHAPVCSVTHAALLLGGCGGSAPLPLRSNPMPSTACPKAPAGRRSGPCSTTSA